MKNLFTYGEVDVKSKKVNERSNCVRAQLCGPAIVLGLSAVSKMKGGVSPRRCLGAAAACCRGPHELGADGRVLCLGDVLLHLPGLSSPEMWARCLTPRWWHVSPMERHGPQSPVIVPRQRGRVAWAVRMAAAACPDVETSWRA